MKIRYVLLCLLCFGLGAAWKDHQAKHQEFRIKPLLNFLTPSEFSEEVAKLNDFGKMSESDDAAYEARMVAHLAEEGYRIGYMEGLRAKRLNQDEDSDEDEN